MAETKRDYYEVLGVTKDADDATLKKAYRKVAKKYHPDVNPGDAEAEKKFKEASEAYAILSDPDKRRQYDQFGHAAFDGSGAAGGAYGGAYSRNGGGTYQYAGPEEPAVLEGSISAAQISVISLVISSAIFSAEAEEADVQARALCRE